MLEVVAFVAWKQSNNTKTELRRVETFLFCSFLSSAPRVNNAQKKKIEIKEKNGWKSGEKWVDNHHHQHLNLS